MIEMLVLAMIASVVLKRGAEDLIHSARGGTPPRYAAASARKKSGAAGKYWSSVWDDVWTDLHKKHVAKRSDPSRPRGAATVFWSNLWRDGWVAAERRRQGKATRPRPETVTVPGEVVPDFEDEARPEDGDGMTIRDKFAPFASTQDGDRTDLTFGDDPTDPTGVSTCPECGGTGVTEDGVCLSCRDRQEQRNQHYEQQEATIKDRDAWLVTPPSGYPVITSDPEMYQNTGYPVQPVRGADGAHGFNVTSYPSPASPSQEGTTMTATTIEVTGLESGITFSETSAQAYTAMVGSIEQTIAALGGFDVGGPAKAAADAAMEQSAAAAQSMLTLAEELKKHRGVAEAIDATPGAGKREFYTAGR
jgi:hypothetical protein